MTRTNVSKLSRLERSFVAETQGPPEIPPRVPAAVVGVEVGRRAGLPIESVAPRIIRLLRSLAQLALPRAISLKVQRASKSATNTVRILLREGRL